jgi:hypothetical protein
VLVLVGRLDRRATQPFEYAWRIPARERRALHVAIDERELWELTDAWTAWAVSSPLHTVENDGGLARTTAKVVEYELDSGFDEVVVLAGRLGRRRCWHRLLHHRRADAIGRAMASIPGAFAALMTVTTT